MTNNLRDEIAARIEVCEAGFKPCPVPLNATHLPSEDVLIAWHKAGKLAKEASREQRPSELAALSDAIAALEFIAQSGNTATSAEALLGTYERMARAALAQIAGRLGHMDVGREGEG